MWRSYTNIIPEAGLQKMLEEEGEDRDEPKTEIEAGADQGVLSKQMY